MKIIGFGKDLSFLRLLNAMKASKRKFLRLEPVRLFRMFHFFSIFKHFQVNISLLIGWIAEATRISINGVLFKLDSSNRKMTRVNVSTNCM